LIPSGIEAERPEIDKAQTQLLDLIVRAEGCAVVSLAEYDLARRDDTTDNARWGNLGEALLLAGHAAEAADAFKRCGRKPEEGLATWARDRAVFLRPGPYLRAPLPAPGAEPAKTKGETLELLMRTKPCYVGKTEVTRAEYAGYVASLKGKPYAKTMLDGREPDTKHDHLPQGWDPAGSERSQLPATGVDFFDAVGFARSRGLKLADAEVLSLAARGPLARSFPWGAEKPGLPFANVGEALEGPTPAGSFPGSASPCGALDLIGNVDEWVFVKVGSEAPTFGGDYKSPPDDLRAAPGAPIDQSERSDTRGFRVMKELAPAG